MTELDPEMKERITARFKEMDELRDAIRDIGDVSAYTAPEGKEGYGVLVKLDKDHAENPLVHDGLLAAFAGHNAGDQPVEVVDYDYGDNGLRLRLKSLEGEMTHEKMVEHVRGVRDLLKGTSGHYGTLNAVLEQGRNVVVTEGNHDVEPVNALIGNDSFVLAGFKANGEKGTFR